MNANIVKMQGLHNIYMYFDPKGQLKSHKVAFKISCKGFV